MRRTSLALAALVTLGFVVTGACNVDYDADSLEEDGRFPCDPETEDEDCPEPDQTCQQNSDKEYVCTSEPTCIDGDQDGYGSPANDPDNGGSGFSTCPACKQDRPGGCDADCDDGNSRIHPGAPERCDDADNDCDGEVDEMDCDPEEGCPFSFGEQGYDTPQSDTSWGCKNVNGSDQCVMTGDFSGSPECNMYENNNGEEATWGICGDNTAGEWTQVPDQCRM